MFMVKSEFANIGNLLKVKMKVHKKIMWFFVIAGLMLIGNLVPAVISIIRNTEPGLSRHTMTDFSTTFFFGAIVAFTVIMFLYRMANNTLSVFPQTNTTRFITTQVINYFIAVCLGLTALAAYLLLYGTFRLLAAFQENVYLTLDFNVGFVIAGFFTFLMYTFLLVAVIELIGAILRKWRHYAAIAFTALISLAIINFEAVVEYAPGALGFLVREPSFGLFMLKAVGLWLAVVAASFAINRFTVYYKIQDAVKTKRTTVVCVIIAVVIVGFVPALVLLNTTTTDATRIAEYRSSSHDVSEAGRAFFAEAREIRIDVSHLPRGSDITLTGENIDESMWATGMAFTTGPGGSPNAFVSGRDALNNIQGDTLVIRFRPPFFHVDGIDIMHHANPRIDVYLDGDVLYIDYNIDTANVVVIPIWGFARQFEVFRDRGLVTAQMFGYSASASITANIFLSVE